MKEGIPELVPESVTRQRMASFLMREDGPDRVMDRYEQDLVPLDASDQDLIVSGKTRSLRLRGLVDRTFLGFKTHEYIVAQVRVDDRLVTMQSEPFNETGMNYVGGRLYTQADVDAINPDPEDVIYAAKMMGKERLQSKLGRVATVHGVYVELADEDRLISSSELV